MVVQKIYGKPLNFSTRKAQAIRKAVYQRDGFACCMCGDKVDCPPDNYTGELTLRIGGGRWLEVDHIVSRFNGGGNEIDNLKTLCNICNTSKGAK